MSPPLAGVRVVVTRAESQSGELAAALTEAGAEVAELPLLEVVPPADPQPLATALADLGHFHWLILTSANAARAVGAGLPHEPPRHLKVAVIGAATAKATEPWLGRPVDVAASTGMAERMAEELARDHLRTGQAVLFPHAADARGTLPAILRRHQIRVEAVVAYAKRLPADAPARAADLFCGSPLGWVTFTSPSTVRHFVEVLAGAWPDRSGELLAASIGPVTTAALRDAGIEPVAEAARPSAEALVAAIVEAVQRPAPSD
ncbi:MAG TPA: uroporphyrinogen-III synthase [Thermoanaerobaculia bacterium]|nr:uroporphyrinogen-III synthase [Thermoanaerobaculia bacterium]